MGVKQEKARQSCWCWTKTGRQLAPVKATRCQKMFDESSAFSRRATACEANVKGLKKAVDGLLGISEKVLTQPLPQVWDNSPDGASVQPVMGTGKPLIQAGQLQRSHSTDLQQKVYDPMASYQKEYSRMKARMADLDKQSLRLDAARRMHYKGAQKHLKENVMQSDNVNARAPKEDENPELVAARNGYQKLEGEVHEELVRLADSARTIQGYLTKAMELMADTLSNAASAHAQPSFAGGASGRGSETGHSVTSLPSAPQHAVTQQQQQPPPQREVAGGVQTL